MMNALNVGARISSRARNLRNTVSIHQIARMAAGAALAAAVLAAGGIGARAETFTLDDAASPIAATFDGDTGRMSVTVKASGMVWKNADSGGDALTLSNAKQESPLRLTAEAVSSNGISFQLGVELAPATGDLIVAIGGDPEADMGRGLNYPYAFFPEDGSGYAVLPFYSGYVVPTANRDWSRSGHSREEWFGGVDADFEQGWMCIADPAADMELATTRDSVGGEERLGGVFRWMGSNANPEMNPNRLSYERKATYRFFTEGGYVAQAKHFRAFAIEKGWFVSLKEKAKRNPNVDKFIGAPVIYVWGDGRTEEMLDALKAAGVEKALIQMNINNTDHRDKFPTGDFPDEKGVGWADAVRARGYIPGIYDIYSHPGGGGTHSPYSGYEWLWPADAVEKWAYVRAPGDSAARAGRGAGGATAAQDAATSPAARRGGAGGGGGRVNFSNQMAAIFARDVRMPKQIEMFGVEAIFLDVVCAVPPIEDYDKTNGHPASRARDIEGRQALLAAASIDHNRITGVEQVKSWAVPYIHWAEGAFLLGVTGPVQSGSWGDFAYPTIMMDHTDPTQVGGRGGRGGRGGDPAEGPATPPAEDRGALPRLLTPGWHAPLWDLTFHDAVVITPHWHVPNNKYLYCWDIYDLFSIIRGQSPLLNLAYEAAPGDVGGPVNSLTDARDGKVWDKRMANPNVAERVAQTYRNVCEWHGKIGYLEMTNHKMLKDDFSVQLSEFSEDGGKTGHGVVVNFGVYDGNYDMTGPDWTGEVRGQSLTVPANSFRTYEW